MNAVQTLQSHCRAAVRRCDITPPVGIYHRMWGAATHDRSTGVHRPLTATVLYLQSLSNDSETPLVAIGLDHCLLWTKEMNQLLEAISRESGVVRDAIVVFFSHTHGAGLMGLERSHLPGGDLIAPYLDQLAVKVADLVEQARAQLAPASIVYGQGKCALATHRDYFDETNGHYVCGFNPDGVADDAVVVGRITSETGQPLGTLVNYACHPTTLAWKNTLISPDYIGAMREVVEATTGVPCLFIQGASGDIGPKEGFVGDPSVADRNGRQLGYSVLSALETLPTAGQQFVYSGPVVSGATLGVWEDQPEQIERQQETQLWSIARRIVPLKYRSDLPHRDHLQADLEHWRAAEQVAVQANDIDAIKQAHAMVERATRSITRAGTLPTGDCYPYPLVAWRIGDAVWLALDGEHYNVLQRILREQFPTVSLVIGTLANGSNVWYLPNQESFGRGLYQEEASILAAGCLEKVIDAAADTIRSLLSR